MSILTTVTALLGVILGTSGLVLGILNYLRDRPAVRVALQWNMEMIGGPAPSGERKCGIVAVSNAGRRPVYISHVCLILPKSYKDRLLLLVDSVRGCKLAEGEAPVTFVVPHDVQDNYERDLVRIRAQVSDSTGRVYLSKHAEKQQAILPGKTN